MLNELAQHGRPLWQQYQRSADEALSSGDIKLAEKHFLLSVLLAEDVAGVRSEELAEACLALADYYMTCERWHDAECQFRRALGLYDRTFGEGSLISAMIYKMLAEICVREARTGEAGVLRDRAAAILERAL
jgi:hypothetical protein